MSGSGNPFGAVPSVAALDQFNVNRDGWEAIKQSLYDSTQYAAAGVQQLSFFAVPVGQGTSWNNAAVASAKTYSDTNMTLAGQMPANQQFLIESIEVAFEPTTPTVAANMPAAVGASAVAAQINDAYIFYRAGNLNLFIGSKSYLQEAPLMKFPSKTYFELHAALSDYDEASAIQSRIAYGTACGRPYYVKPADLRLVSNQNFGVTLNWPEGVQAVTNPARVIVTLDGFLYRRSQ